ncbi:DUF2069 domain-containing protein [Wielerella bovis]|uniref:DUF2069 domain-containing protein n=1 Tax=Wielerella bovis TaxID=2917790 RepID=UPI003D2E5FA7
MIIRLFFRLHFAARQPENRFWIMSQTRLILLHIPRIAWLLLIILTLVWDWIYAPLGTGYILLLIKLVPLLLPIRGILSGKIYTYQYCSMLIMAYFIEGVMRLWDIQAASRWFAAMEIVLTLIFFSGCLCYLKQFKIKKDKI